MSTNLYCNCKGVKLYQTPTHITRLIMSINPDTEEPDGGNAGVRRRYFHWLDYNNVGPWKSNEERLEDEARIIEHKAEILAFGTDIEFYMF